LTIQKIKLGMAAGSKLYILIKIFPHDKRFGIDWMELFGNLFRRTKHNINSSEISFPSGCFLIRVLPVGFINSFCKIFIGGKGCGNSLLFIFFAPELKN